MTHETDPDASRLTAEDERDIRRLGLLYASALDHNEPGVLENVFTPSATWRRGNDVRTGLAALRHLPTRLRKAYRKTLHRVFNQVVVAEGEGATMETYCTADHLERDTDVVYSVTLRYVDRVVRTPQGWRIDERELFVLWATESNVEREPAPRLPPPDSLGG